MQAISYNRNMVEFCQARNAIYSTQKNRVDSGLEEGGFLSILDIRSHRE